MVILERRISRPVRNDIVLAAIMNQNRRVARDHIVRVDAIDGEVVGGGQSLGAGAEAYYADDATVGGEELVASV